MFKSILKNFNRSYYSDDNVAFSKVDPNLVRYFRTEYGRDWKSALEYHLYKKSLKNNKKAA